MIVGKTLFHTVMVNNKLRNNPRFTCDEGFTISTNMKKMGVRNF